MSLGWLGVACLAPACGGGAPLLHPAHALGAGEVGASAGLAYQAPQGALSRAMERSNDTSSTLEALATEAVVGPGLSPVGAVRAGVGRGAELGGAWTGRTAHLGARQTARLGEWALSLGANGSVALGQLDSTTPVRAPIGDIESLRGGGFDIPLLLGWRSTGSVVQLWVGARAGAEWLRADLVSDPAQSALAMSGRRVFAGGGGALFVGSAPFWVGLQLMTSYTWVHARTSGLDLDRHGLVLTPAAAMVIRL